jgi:anti-anti-sigma factor
MTRRTDPDHGRLTVETNADGAALRIVLRGEADVTSLPDLRGALAGIALDGTREVDLDVSGLAFLDVAALRHLTLFARELGEGGRRLRTRGATPAVAHLIRLVGVDGDLGLDGTAGPDAG